MKKFDGTWEEFWKNTASNMAESKISASEATNQFIILKTTLKHLRDENMNPPMKKLSKENKKKIELAMENLKKAAKQREAAADNAIKTINGDYGSINKSKENIDKSDEYILNGAIEITKVESDLDLLDEYKQ